MSFCILLRYLRVVLCVLSVKIALNAENAEVDEEAGEKLIFVSQRFSPEFTTKLTAYIYSSSKKIQKFIYYL